MKKQPPPPRIVFEALLHPDRDPARPWLSPGTDEVLPTVIESSAPSLVVWSSLWAARPDARVRFDLTPAGYATELRWTLFVDEPVPDDEAITRMCTRINRLINADLRYTFGQ